METATNIHHVEVITADMYSWGYHCLTCGQERDGLACIEAAEDAADAHRLASFLDLTVIRTAINNPSQFVARGDNFREPRGAWCARAVVAALTGGA